MSGAYGGVPLNSVEAPTAVTLGASPFTWTNTTDGPAQVIVSGGTVTAINLVVGGVDYLAGVLAGVFTARAGAGIKVTYTVAPTMTYVRL